MRYRLKYSIFDVVMISQHFMGITQQNSEFSIGTTYFWER